MKKCFQCCHDLSKREINVLPVTMGLLDTTSGGGTFAGSLGGQLLSRSLSSSGLTSCLLGTSHYDKVSPEGNIKNLTKSHSVSLWPYKLSLVLLFDTWTVCLSFTQFYCCKLSVAADSISVSMGTLNNSFREVQSTAEQEWYNLLPISAQVSINCNRIELKRKLVTLNM